MPVVSDIVIIRRYCVSDGFGKRFLSTLNGFNRMTGSGPMQNESMRLNPCCEHALTGFDLP